MNSVSKLASPYLPDTSKIQKATEKAIRTNSVQTLEKILQKTEIPLSVIEAIIRIVKMAIQVGISLPS